MNKVILVGRLTKDPELYTKASSSVVRFNIAIDRKFKREGEQTADFPSCIAFGKTAEFINKYFNKGNRIGIVGRIQTGSYKNKDGQTVYTTDVIVEEVEFVENKSTSTNNNFMDIPDDTFGNLPFG